MIPRFTFACVWRTSTKLFDRLLLQRPLRELQNGLSLAWWASKFRLLMPGHTIIRHCLDSSRDTPSRHSKPASRKILSKPIFRCSFDGTGNLELRWQFVGAIFFHFWEQAWLIFGSLALVQIYDKNMAKLDVRSLFDLVGNRIGIGCLNSVSNFSGGCFTWKHP